MSDDNTTNDPIATPTTNFRVSSDREFIDAYSHNASEVAVNAPGRVFRLDTNARINTLFALRRWVQSVGRAERISSIEMTAEQYCEYKRLVFEADFVRYFDGLEIKISTPEASTEGDGPL